MKRGSKLFIVAVTLGFPIIGQCEDKSTPIHQIEEVIVSATKRDESIRDVAASVSAVSGSLLERNNIQDFQDLVALVPSMVAQDESRIAIRGVSKGSLFDASPVAFHVNGVFLGIRGEPFYDLEGVEVLRGPSGIAFGRNATGGAINVKWKRPDAELGVGGVVRYSDLEDQQLKAWVNIPFLGEDDRRLLGRLAAIKRRGDGTLNDALATDNPGHLDDWFVRLYLTSEPTDNLELSLRAIRYNADAAGGTETLNFVGSPSLNTRLSGELEAAGAPSLPRDITKVLSNRDERLGVPTDEFTRIDGDLTWSLTEIPLFGDFDLVMVGGEMHRKTFRSVDLDGTVVQLTESKLTMDNEVRKNAELRFVSNNDSGFDWLFGLFWYKETGTLNEDDIARVYFAPTAFGVPLIPGVTNQGFYGDTTQSRPALDRPIEGKAAFLKLDFDMAQLFGWPRIEFTAGIRQNKDKTDEIDSGIVVDIVAVNGLPIVPINFINDGPSRAPIEYDVTTGELSGRWFYTDDGMAYAKISKGYKPGRSQKVLIDFMDYVSQPIEPEYITAVEIGWKSEFFNRQLALSVAAFNYDYTDLQVDQITASGVLVENAASAKIKGIDIELHWSPSEAFDFQASAGFLDAQYDEYCGSDGAREAGDTAPGCSDEKPLDFSGDRLRASPEMTAALLASYTFSLGSMGSLTPAIKSAWSATQNRRGLGHPEDEVQSYSNTDISLAWKNLSQSLEVTAFVQGLEDNNDIFFQSQAPLIVNRPGTFALLSNLPPRIFGITLTASF